MRAIEAAPSELTAAMNKILRVSGGYIKEESAPGEAGAAPASTAAA